MTTLTLVTRARKVAQARWEHAMRAKRMAIAASNRYQALLYEYYAEAVQFGDEVQPPPVAGALGLSISRQEQAAETGVDKPSTE